MIQIKHFQVHRIALAAAMILSTAMATPTWAEPRILTVPDRTEATLPGASHGASLGIVIRRGSGFPEPEPEVVEPPTVDQATEAPSQTRRVVIRRSRYGY